jgi:hypothetical protein
MGGILMNRFFKISYDQYEKIRANMDANSGFPSTQAESWFVQAKKAPTANDGSIIIAAVPEIAEEFIKSGGCEISIEAYFSYIDPSPRPAP